MRSARRSAPWNVNQRFRVRPIMFGDLSTSTWWMTNPSSACTSTLAQYAL
jgi:hypothetical protein